MPDLWLPKAESDRAMRAAADAAIDEMLRLVNEKVSSMVEVATLTGAKRHVAAAMLRRAIELLMAAREADHGPTTSPAIELVTRSIFELASRARYLLLCDRDDEEFVRMCHDYESRETKLAKATGNVSPGLPSFIAAAIAGTSPKPPRDLLTICDTLDKQERRKPGDPYSARSSYYVFYAWLSNSASHAGLAALKRFGVEEGGVLHMVVAPEPLTTHWPIPLAASQIGELAQAVFRSFGFSVDDLAATEVALPAAKP